MQKNKRLQWILSIEMTSRRLLATAAAGYIVVTDGTLNSSHCGYHGFGAWICEYGCTKFVGMCVMPARSMVRGPPGAGWMHMAFGSGSGPQFCCARQFESWMTSVMVPPPSTGRVALSRMGKVSCTPSVLGIEFV